MKGKLLVLSMELKSQKDGNFLFNEVQIQALLAGLSAVYSEAALWLMKRKLVVMVVGEKAELLVQAFMHFKNQYGSMQLLTDNEADQFIKTTLENKNLDNKSMDKLIQLNHCQQQAIESESLGPVLSELIEKMIIRLKTEPLIAGYRNSWKYARMKSIRSRTEKAKVDVMEETLYRFGIN